MKRTRACARSSGQRKQWTECDGRVGPECINTPVHRRTDNEYNTQKNTHKWKEDASNVGTVIRTSESIGMENGVLLGFWLEMCSTQTHMSAASTHEIREYIHTDINHLFNIYIIISIAHCICIAHKYKVVSLHNNKEHIESRTSNDPWLK